MTKTNSARDEISPKVKWQGYAALATAIVVPAIVVFLQSIPESAFAGLGEFSGAVYAFVGAIAAGLAGTVAGYKANDHLRNKGADVEDADVNESLPPAGDVPAEIDGTLEQNVEYSPEVNVEQLNSRIDNLLRQQGGVA